MPITDEVLKNLDAINRGCRTLQVGKRALDGYVLGWSDVQGALRI